MYQKTAKLLCIGSNNTHLNKLSEPSHKLESSLKLKHSHYFALVLSKILSAEAATKPV